jgi:FKBP-type peptidyl-prolyl cis-trans isomerase
MKKLIAVILFTVAVTGCNNWERTTFQTLSASKATIDNAQAQYEAKAIAQTTCAYAIINDAKASQTVAVNGFLAYEQVKTAKGDIATAEATVTTELVALVPLVAQVTSLLSNPAAPCTGAAK